MNHRERVLSALNHEQPDRVPIDLGGSLATSINIGAYEKLKIYLGLDAPSEILSLRSMIARVEEEILVRYDVDTRSLPMLGNSRPSEQLPDGSFRDEWGIVRRQPQPGATSWTFTTLSMASGRSRIWRRIPGPIPRTRDTPTAWPPPPRSYTERPTTR